jgi:hypothetical protein
MDVTGPQCVSFSITQLWKTATARNGSDGCCRRPIPPIVLSAQVDETCFHEFPKGSRHRTRETRLGVTAKSIAVTYDGRVLDKVFHARRVTGGLPRLAAS